MCLQGRDLHMSFGVDFEFYISFQANFRWISILFFPSSRYNSGQKFYSLTWQTMHYFRHNPWTSSKINGTSILGMRGARNLLLPTGLAPLMQISQRGQIFPEVTFFCILMVITWEYAKISVKSHCKINCDSIVPITTCDQF